MHESIRIRYIIIQITHLDNGFRTGNFKHLTGTEGTIGKTELDDLGVFREFDLVEDNQRAVDTGDSFVRWNKVT